eukprot:TRINITY_DN2690_c0_g1_i1.p1 TRINITY_DN2690_c0_g1~~TRINITY_DN2690_c0_g1_i1.p1  ORF type:complete len:646 (+),score=109.29 TRINITY_DN2690_c0_g1_i1:136-1938(+)
MCIRDRYQRRVHGYLMSNQEGTQVPLENEIADNQIQIDQADSQQISKEQHDNSEVTEKSDQKIYTLSYIIIFLFLLAILGLFLYSFHQDAKKQKINKISLASRNYDTRNYKLVRLSNDMKVLVIQDEELQEAAIAVNVGVGSYSSPQDFPGLAHFLEHMLFMGSKKYPDVNQFTDFITTNDGEFNAYTAQEQTNYFFSVPFNAFYEGMDIFSRFFIDPLLAQEYINSEIDAITNEYEISLTSQGWQQMFALRQIANKTHPFSYFSCGNRDTLMTEPQLKGKNVYHAMENFYNQHYSSNIMSLVVISKEDPEKMLDVINNKFISIKNKQLDQTTFNNSGKIFTKENRGSLLKFISSSSDYKLVIIFELEEVITKYNEQPLDFIDYFISNEGKKSFKSILLQKGWIYNLDSGSDSNTAGTLYEVELTLSEEGITKIQEILQLFFSYIDLIKKQGVTKENYEEVRSKANLTFQYSEKFDIMTEAHNCAGNMQYYPLELALLGQSLYKKYDEKMIKDYLAQMIPENGIYLFSTSKFAAQNNQTKQEESQDNQDKNKKDEDKKKEEMMMFQANKINQWNQKKLLFLNQFKENKKFIEINMSLIIS